MSDKVLPHLMKGTVWRHVRRKTQYTVIAIAALQCPNPDLDHQLMVVYKDENGITWVRAYHEFTDGRFERVTDATHNKQS